MNRAPPLFHPLLEKVNLAIPFGFVLAYAGLIVSGYHFENWNLLNILTWYLFMDVTHTGFTLVMLSVLPEPRQMLKDAIVHHRSWLILAVLLLITFPFFFVASWSDHIVMDEYWGSLSTALVNGLWNQHAISQIFGVSMLYNRLLPELNARESKWERISFKILIYSAWSIPLGYLYLQDYILPALIFAVVTCGAIVCILLMAFRQSRRFPTNKFIYQLRLLLWASATIHPVLMSGIMAFHAFEYLAVFQRMYSRSSYVKNPLSVIAFWGLALFLYPVTRYHLALPPNSALAFFIVWLAGFGRSLDFLHYYVDGIIFRFREAEPRRWVAPLL